MQCRHMDVTRESRHRHLSIWSVDAALLWPCVMLLGVNAPMPQVHRMMLGIMEQDVPGEEIEAPDGSHGTEITLVCPQEFTRRQFCGPITCPLAQWTAHMISLSECIFPEHVDKAPNCYGASEKQL